MKNTKTLTNKFTLSLISMAVLAIPTAFAESTPHGQDITAALQDSKANVSFRGRYEGVEQTGINEDATAFTVKSRFTVNTGNYQNFSLGLEVDNVTAFIDDYNSKTNGNTQYPVIADPEGTDVNQAFVKYSNSGFTGTVGRQRILHNNQRFVGGVGWRQNEQTYDGLRAQYAAGAFKVDYSYIHNINGITGGDVSGDFHLVNANFKINKSHKVSAFTYILDYNAASQAKNSSSTYGGLYNGKFGPVFVNASVASQSDNGDNATSYSALYLNAEAGSKFGAVTVLAGYELLGSDNGVGFNTPLATKHKFQGWADKFLGTPGEGIADVYFTVKGSISGVKLSATYHNMTSDVDNINYGDELDLAASYKINKNYSVLVKYANFASEDYATDTNKLWLQGVAKF